MLISIAYFFMDYGPSKINKWWEYMTNLNYRMTTAFIAKKIKVSFFIALVVASPCMECVLI